jgi:PAS domain S-box-containing protein
VTSRSMQNTWLWSPTLALRAFARCFAWRNVRPASQTIARLLKDTQAEHRADMQRLYATYDLAPVGITEVDRSGRIVRANAHYCRMIGCEKEELIGRHIDELITPEDRESSHDLFERQMRGECPVYSYTKHYVRSDGRIRLVSVTASTVTDSSGVPLYSIRISRDVTDEREAQTALIRELHHRVKNTIATVQSVVTLTIQAEKAPRNVVDKVAGRMRAMAAAHTALSDTTVTQHDLHSIVDRALSGYPNMTCLGPEVALTVEQVMCLSQVLHELATNAAKYGSLSVIEGAVLLLWWVKDGRLHLSWTERNGPPVTPPTRAGLGSKLIARLLQAANAEHDTIWAPEGLRVSIEMPIAQADDGDPE